MSFRAWCSSGVLTAISLLCCASLWGQSVLPANPSKEYIYLGGKLVAVDAPDTVPAAPGSLNATANSSSQITLTWTDTSNNEHGFKIERKTGAGGTYAQIDTVGPNATTYPSTGLTGSTTYFYRIRSYNGAGNSSYSNEDSATTSPSSPPTAPTNLIAVKASSAQINLTWTDTSTGETGFRIERKLGQGGTYSEIATVGANATSYPSTGLANGTVYYYRVRAYNGLGNSGYSNESNACTGTLSGNGTYDGQSSNIVYSGTWVVDGGSYPRAHNSTMKYTNTSQAKATFSFSGDRVTWRFSKHTHFGIANVKIDGVNKGNFDQYSIYRLWRVDKTYGGLGSGNHTIEITVTGSKNGSSTDYYMDVDALVVGISSVGSGTYDDQHSQLKFNGTTWDDDDVLPLAYNSTTTYSDTTEDSFTFTFTGTSIRYYYAKSPNRGKASIAIDGVSYGTVDLYSSTIQWQQNTLFSSLGSGVHTIHISVTGTKHASATDYYIDVDRLVVP